jgi:GntR family transcriptional regulator
MAKNQPLKDSLSRVPAYIQVASAIRRRIEAGYWKALDRIPTIEEFEMEFDVSRVTVIKAIELLEEEKLLKRQQGRGTFLLQTPQDKRWLILESSLEGMARSIEQNVPQFVPTSSPPAFPLLDDEGTLADEYTFLKSVQKKDGIPYALVSVHLDRSIYEKHKSLFMKETALSVLSKIRGIDIQKAHQTYSVQTAEKDIANVLRVSLSAPTVQCRCVLRNSRDVAIYVADIIYRGDCLKLSVDLL